MPVTSVWQSPALELDGLLNCTKWKDRGGRCYFYPDPELLTPALGTLLGLAFLGV